MVRKGDVVRFKPEWSDPEDCRFRFVAIEDQDGERVLIETQLGLTVNPTQFVYVDQLELDPCAS